MLHAVWNVTGLAHPPWSSGGAPPAAKSRLRSELGEPRTAARLVLARAHTQARARAPSLLRLCWDVQVGGVDVRRFGWERARRARFTLSALEWNLSTTIEGAWSFKRTLLHLVRSGRSRRGRGRRLPCAHPRGDHLPD